MLAHQSEVERKVDSEPRVGTGQRAVLVAPRCTARGTDCVGCSAFGSPVLGRSDRSDERRVGGSGWPAREQVRGVSARSGSSGAQRAGKHPPREANIVFKSPSLMIPSPSASMSWQGTEARRQLVVDLDRPFIPGSKQDWIWDRREGLSR